MKTWTLLLMLHSVLHFSFQWNVGLGFFLLYSTILGRSTDRFSLPMFSSVWKECVDLRIWKRRKLYCLSEKGLLCSIIYLLKLHSGDSHQWSTFQREYILFFHTCESKPRILKDTKHIYFSERVKENFKKVLICLTPLGLL